MPEFQISRFGVIPKSSQPGHWRLILDLSTSWTLQHQWWHQPSVVLTGLSYSPRCYATGTTARTQDIAGKNRHWTSFQKRPCKPQGPSLTGQTSINFIDTVLPLEDLPPKSSVQSQTALSASFFINMGYPPSYITWMISWLWVLPTLTGACPTYNLQLIWAPIE